MELRVGQADDPRAVAHLFGVAASWQCLVERLLEDAQGTFQVETSEVGAPENGHVQGLETMSSRPELPGRLRRLRQATDFDVDQCVTH